MEIDSPPRRGPQADTSACMQRTSTRICTTLVILVLHTLQMTYQSKLKQFWRKRASTGTARVGVRFGVHRESAEGHATHAVANQISQGWKGIDHREEVIEVPERNTQELEASYSCECREKEWEAGMKRDVL